MDEEPLVSYPKRRSRGANIAFWVCFSLIVVLVIFTTIISVIVPKVLSEYGKSMAQNALDASVVTLVSSVVMSPGQDNITMNSIVQISGAGNLAATIGAANVTVAFENQEFGWILLPEAQLQASVPTSLNQTVVLVVTNKAVYQAQARAVLSGNTIAWRGSGDLQLTVKQLGLSLKFKVRAEKDFLIPGKKLMNITAFDINVFASTNTTLSGSVTQTFYNPSIIAVKDFGRTSFDIFSKEDNIRIGYVVVDQFEVNLGYNRFSTGITTVTRLEPGNKAAVERFMSAWGMGKTQTVILRGPTSSIGGDFLLDVSETEATVIGNPFSNLIQRVFFLDYIYPYQTVYNPIGMSVTQTNFNFQVTSGPVGSLCNAYTGLFYYFGNNVTCLPSPDFGKVTGATSSVTIPSKSFQNISLAPIDSTYMCTMLRPFAQCAGLISGNYSSGDCVAPNTTSFYVSTYGSFDINIGNFSFTQTYSQDNILFDCSGRGLDFYSNLLSNFKSSFCLAPPEESCTQYFKIWH